MADDRRILWAIPAFLALHNLEEALTFPHFLPHVRDALPEPLQPLAAAVTDDSLRVALLVATAVPLGIVAWARRRPTSRAALWCALLVQSVLALNVASHVVIAAFLLRGYSPGLLTAVAANLPFSIYLLRRAVSEQWLPRYALAWLAPAALVVHGPRLVALVLSTATRVRR
jgi:hypothetical protein